MTSYIFDIFGDMAAANRCSIFHIVEVTMNDHLQSVKKNSFLLIIIFLGLFSGCTDNGKIKPYVKSNLKSISTISPDSIDFSDLAPISDAIGDAKIVMLGEQDHGDAPTFLAKTRLIKFLHEEKGFNVLVFESDFFSLNKGWDSVIKNDSNIASFLKTNIFSMWTGCAQCQNLLDSYIPRQFRTAAPLQISGLDCQFNGNYAGSNLKYFLSEFLENSGVSYVKRDEYKTIFLPSLYHLYRNAIDNDDVAYYEKLEAISDSLLSQTSGIGENSFEKAILHNLKAFFKQCRLRGSVESNETRDIRMAENLKWLIQNKFPNEKIIVWAANAHIFKNCDGSFSSDKMKYKRMGDVFTSDPLYTDNTYVLGFTSKSGMGGRLNSERYLITPSKEESLENWIDGKIKYGFIDFQLFNQQNSPSPLFYMKGNHESSLARWTKIYNGVFYIRDMYPCTEIR